MYQKKYKLTDQNRYTRYDCSNGIKWKIGVWHEATGDIKNGLCSDAFIHWYDSPELAILLNPIHAGIKNPRLWECEIDGETKTDKGLKGGSRRVRIMRELPVLSFTTEQCVKFAILCTKQVYNDPKWNEWADNWLSGVDRSYAAANAATNVADAAYAANAAANAAANVADAAAYAAYAAANAAANVADAIDTGSLLDLVAIAKQAVED